MHVASCPESFPTAPVPSVTAQHSVFTRLELAEKERHNAQHMMWTIVDFAPPKKHKTHTRLLTILASSSTFATVALNTDGGTSSPKWKPPLLKLSGIYHKCGKLQLKKRNWTRCVSRRANNHQRADATSCLCQHLPWVNGGQNACHRTLWTTRGPAASHPKRGQHLRASLDKWTFAKGKTYFGDAKYGGIDPNGKSNAQLWRRAHKEHNRNRD